MLYLDKNKKFIELDIFFGKNSTLSKFYTLTFRELAISTSWPR